MGGAGRRREEEEAGERGGGMEGERGVERWGREGQRERREVGWGGMGWC